MNQLLAHRLKEFRLAGHYTQSYVSSQIHLSRSAYSNYENGKRVPTLDIVCALAQFYGISIDELIGRSAPVVSDIPLNHEERYIIYVYRKQTERKKEQMLSMVRTYQQE